MFPRREALAPDNGTARHFPSGAAEPDQQQLSPRNLATAIRDAALTLGFARVGFCPLEPFEQAGAALGDWLARGLHGEMAYLAGEARHEPLRLLPEARSLVVVALPYAADDSRPSGARGLPLTGQIARYARGADYHSVLKERLRQLADHCAELTGRSVLARPCVDTAPLLEREAARRAGIGFTAKSTLTIAPGLGSYVLLGELLLDLELELVPEPPLARGCGSCTSCLVACPTSAFVDAYSLDARRCISYLTIELKGAIPRALRPLIGRWVFGCDVCQEVCPFNQSRRPRAADPALTAQPRLTEPELVALLELSASGYRRFVKRSALRRIGRVQLQRNAAVALGNSGLAEAVPALGRCLGENPSPLVREHAAWALGRLPGEAARELLRAHREREREASVSHEIDLALAQC
jgi:epoxyqueuosine reductase